jgi:SnoaL-like domain
MAGSDEGLTPEERWEVSDLLARCAFASDTRDMALLDEVFVPEATGSFGPAGEPQGLDAIKTVFLQVLEPLDATQHSLTTSLVTRTPTGAHARTYFVTQHVLGAELFSVAGTYEDDLAQRDGKWRLTHRTIDTTWTGGNPAVLGLGH